MRRPETKPRRPQRHGATIYESHFEPPRRTPDASWAGPLGANAMRRAGANDLPTFCGEHSMSERSAGIKKEKCAGKEQDGHWVITVPSPPRPERAPWRRRGQNARSRGPLIDGVAQCPAVSLRPPEAFRTGWGQSVGDGQKCVADAAPCWVRLSRLGNKVHVSRPA